MNASNSTKSNEGILKEAKISYLQESILSNLKSCNNTFEVINRLTDIPIIRNSFLASQPNGDVFIKELQAKINSLSSRIIKNNFEIAIIGLEGSGKSTFINALIGEDLLPTDPNSRCTYASVELYPLAKGAKPYIEIAMKTSEEFVDYIAELNAVIANPTSRITQIGTTSFETELKSITDSKGAISSDISEFLTGEVIKANIEIKDNNLEFELKNTDEILKNHTFKEFVSDKHLARAVKSIKIHCALNINSGKENKFIIYDIPGYNSPLSYHQQQTEQRLKSADAIVCVYSLSQDRVNIESSTTNIMNVGKLLDTTIDIRNKLFVFINKCDKLSETEFQSRTTIAKDEWSKYCKSENIVVGSALGHLSKLGIFNNDAILAHLTSLTMVNIDGTVNAGIEQLTAKIQAYIDDDCLKVYEKVSEEYVNATISIINELRGIIEDKFDFSAPKDSDEEKRINSIRVNAFKEWFNSRWNATIKDFDSWYYTNIINDTEETQKMHENLLNMDAIIKEFIAEIVGNTSDNIEECVNRTMIANVPQYNFTNYEMRKTLHELSINRLDDISRKMASNLTSATTMILDKMCTMFFGIGINELTNAIYETNDTDRVLLAYKAAINALFVRFARPIVDIYMGKPHGSIDRSIILQKYNIDIEILKLYYEKTSTKETPASITSLNASRQEKAAAAAPVATEPAKATSMKEKFSFLTSTKKGEEVVFNIPEINEPTTKEAVAPEESFTAPEEVKSQPNNTIEVNVNSSKLLNDIINNLNTSKSANSTEQIISELTADAKNMGVLLSDIFYTASGINSYCLQEFERIRREIYINKNLFWSLLYDACNDGMVNDFEINFKEKEIIYRQYINLLRSYESLK